MSVNESKIKSLAAWAKWNANGAVGNMDTATVQQAEKQKLPILGIARHYQGPAEGMSTLSLGETVVNKGIGWMVTKPVAYLIAPGQDYKLGEVVNKYPKGTIRPETLLKEK